MDTAQALETILKVFFAKFYGSYLSGMETSTVSTLGCSLASVMHRKKKQSFSFRVYEHEFQGLLVEVTCSTKKSSFVETFGSADTACIENFSRSSCRRMGIECKDS